jgi:hypothetical protein
MAGRNPYLIARFWAKVEVGSWGPAQCWPWNGGASEKGYGRFKVGAGLISPHVFAYEYFYGKPIDRPGYHGAVIRHTCDNPRCCNPAHLIAGTQAANIEDMDRKGRRVIGQFAGNQWHKLDAEKAEDIRARLAGGERPSAIAAAYNVDPSLVRQIGAGKVWKAG